MHNSDIFYTIWLDQHCIWSEMPNLTGRGPYQNATQFTSYTLFCYGTCITNEGLHTILVTCDLFPVVMTSFNTAAFLLLEPLINMHLTICHILFKTSCHINFNIKRFCLNRGCGTTAGWKTFLNINFLLGGKPQASCTKHSMTVSANISKAKLIAWCHPLRNARDFTDVFRGAHISSLPTNVWLTENNIPVPLLANHIAPSKFWKVDLDPQGNLIILLDLHETPGKLYDL